MVRSHPINGYRSKTAAASAMAEAGHPIDVIAKALGIPRRRVPQFIHPASGVVIEKEPRGPFTYAKPRPSSIADEIFAAAARKEQRRTAFPMKF